MAALLKRQILRFAHFRHIAALESPRQHIHKVLHHSQQRASVSSHNESRGEGPSALCRAQGSTPAQCAGQAAGQEATWRPSLRPSKPVPPWRSTRNPAFGRPGPSSLLRSLPTAAESGAGTTRELPTHLGNLKMEPVVIVFDLETSGLDRPRILELAARDLGGGADSALHTLVNPGHGTYVHPEATKLHGIRWIDVQKPTVPSMEVVGEALFRFVEYRRIVHFQRQAEAHRQAPQFAATTPGTPPSMPPVILVAHNGNSFDFRVLRAELCRAGLPPMPGHWFLLDSLPLFRKLLKGKPKGFKLGVLHDHFLEKEPALLDSFGTANGVIAHSSMGDVDMLCSVLLCVMRTERVSFSDLVSASCTVIEYENKKDNPSSSLPKGKRKQKAPVMQDLST